MTGHTYKPGDVALVEAGCWANRKVALRLAEGWAHVNGISLDDDGIVSPVRPLVVIDPDDRQQVEELCRRYVEAYGGRWDGRVAEVTDMQAALRSLTEPPKPEEPGTWGVVEAACVHSDQRQKWVRHEDGNWWPTGLSTPAVNPDDWGSLIDPVVVREGVPADA